MILIYPGDLVVSGINAAKGAIGIYEGVANKPIAATIHYSTYSPNTDKTDIRYLWWFLRSRKGRKRLSQLMPSGIKTELRANRFLKLEISLPPVSLQRSIAHRIDRLATLNSQLRRLRLNAIQEAKALLVSASRRIFDTKGKEGWLNLTVEDCCEALIDYRGRTPPLELAGIPHITSANIRNGILDWTTTKFVSEETYRTFMTRGIPRRGDVLFTMEAPLGETAVIPDDRRFSLAQRTLLLRAKEGVTDGRFLPRVLTNPSVREEIYTKATGTTVKGISSRRLSKVTLPIPPRIQQQRIVQYLEQLEAKARALADLQLSTNSEIAEVLPSVLETAF